MKIFSAIIIVLFLSHAVYAGPIAAGICYAGEKYLLSPSNFGFKYIFCWILGCAGMVVACFAAAGFTFGTLPGEYAASFN